METLDHELGVAQGVMPRINELAGRMNYIHIQVFAKSIEWRKGLRKRG